MPDAMDYCRKDDCAFFFERSDLAAERFGKAQRTVSGAGPLGRIFFVRSVGCLPPHVLVVVWCMYEATRQARRLGEVPDSSRRRPFESHCASPTRRRGRGRLESMERSDAGRRGIYQR